MPPPDASSSGMHLSAGISALAEADQTAAEAQELQSILEARDKLQSVHLILVQNCKPFHGHLSLYCVKIIVIFCISKTKKPLIITMVI